MRSLWKGALSFGLVHIPVRLYSAADPKELKFKLLHEKDHGEIRYARFCTAEGKEVPWEEIVKGYEYEKGEYIALTEEDFQKANLKKTQTIEILDFVNEEEVDKIYYDIPYYIEPEKGAKEAYALLREALKKSKKVAIGRFVFHHREHIGAIYVCRNILVLHKLRYQAEMRGFETLNIPKTTTPIAKIQLDMAIKLIEELTQPFHIKNYEDTYTKEIKTILKKKAKGVKVSFKKAKGDKPEKVHDILSLLKESLKKQGKTTKKKRAA